MNYECPSCKMYWEDDQAPLNKLCHPLCIFCSSNHTQKELLNWQMDHIDQINTKHHGLVLRHFYRYVENELKLMQGKLDDIKGKEDRTGDDGEKSQCW